MGRSAAFTSRAPRRSRPWLGLVAGGLAVLFVGPGALSAEQRPRAVPVEPVAHRGIVAPGEVVVHEFLVRNAGDAALTLRPRPRSRAATVEAPDAPIGPGEVGQVRVAVDTWELRGLVELIASVVTNDPDQREFALRLKLDAPPSAPRAQGAGMPICAASVTRTGPTRSSA